MLETPPPFPNGFWRIVLMEEVKAIDLFPRKESVPTRKLLTAFWGKLNDVGFYGESFSATYPEISRRFSFSLHLIMALHWGRVLRLRLGKGAKAHFWWGSRRTTTNMPGRMGNRRYPKCPARNWTKIWLAYSEKEGNPVFGLLLWVIFLQFQRSLLLLCLILLAPPPSEAKQGRLLTQFPLLLLTPLSAPPPSLTATELISLAFLLAWAYPYTQRSLPPRLLEVCSRETAGWRGRREPNQNTWGCQNSVL